MSVPWDQPLSLQYLRLIEIRTFSLSFLFSSLFLSFSSLPLPSVLNVLFLEPLFLLLNISGLDSEPCQRFLEATRVLSPIVRLLVLCCFRGCLQDPHRPSCLWAFSPEPSQLASQVSSAQLSGRQQQAIGEVWDGFWSSPCFSPPWVYPQVLVSILLPFLLVPAPAAPSQSLETHSEGGKGLGHCLALAVRGLVSFWLSPLQPHFSSAGSLGL